MKASSSTQALMSYILLTAVSPFAAAKTTELLVSPTSVKATAPQSKRKLDPAKALIAEHIEPQVRPPLIEMAPVDETEKMRLGTGSTGGGTFAELDFAKSGWQKYFRLQRKKLNEADLDVLASILKKTILVEASKVLMLKVDNQSFQKKDALNFPNGEVPCDFLFCKDPNAEMVKFPGPVILFNSIAWKGKTAQEKQAFAFHEYRGILGSDRSNYEISARIAAQESELESQQDSALASTLETPAPETLIQNFLLQAGHRLDEIHAILAADSNKNKTALSLALTKAETLRLDILRNLGVDTRTNKPRAPLYNLVRTGVGCEKAPDRKSIINTLTQDRFRPYFDLIIFQKLFAATYWKVYSRYFNGNPDPMARYPDVYYANVKNFSPYLDWVLSFKVKVGTEGCEYLDEYIDIYSVNSLEAYHYEERLVRSQLGDLYSNGTSTSSGREYEPKRF